MFDFIKIINCCRNTSRTIKLYDLLIDIAAIGNLDSKDFMLLKNKIIKCIEKEYQSYKKLSNDNIMALSDEIKKIISAEGLFLGSTRIGNQLSIAYDKLSGCSLINKDLFLGLDECLDLSIIDLINSKIAIDIYKLLNRKLKGLSFDDENLKSYVDKINILNVQHMIYGLSLYEVSERLAITNNYDISLIPDIDLVRIEKKILDDKGVTINLMDAINENIYTSVIDLINGFEFVSLMPNDYISIYNNLVCVTQFEVLLSYLNKKQLMFISSYCNGINTNNKIAIGNIKRLVKDKINGVNS